MCWGVRNMSKFQLASVTSPSVEFEVGGQVVQSKVIKSTKKNPNFDEPLLFFDIVSFKSSALYCYCETFFIFLKKNFVMLEIHI